MNDIAIESRSKILALQSAIGQCAQVDLPLTHYFADGVYVRQIFMPAGTVVVGKIHMREHVNIVSCGDVTCFTEFQVARFQGPKTFISTPGTKRALYVHEHTIWSTIHRVDHDDIAKLEDELVVETYAEYDKKLIEGIL
jgi:hypothetical protein